MKRVLYHIDRWGPGVVALVTFIVMVGLAWQYDRRLSILETGKDHEIARLKEQIVEIRDDSRQREARLQSEIQMWQACTIALRVDMLRAGVAVTVPEENIRTLDKEK